MNFKNRTGALGGRPFTEEEPVDQELTVKMPKSMKEKIRSKAARRRGSLAEAARTYIRAGMEAEQRKAAQTAKRGWPREPEGLARAA